MGKQFADYLDNYSERAAIMQFDAGYDKRRAESMASLECRKVYAASNGIEVDNPDVRAFGQQLVREGRV